LRSYFEKPASSDSAPAAAAGEVRNEDRSEGRHLHAAAAGAEAKEEDGHGASVGGERLEPPWARSAAAEPAGDASGGWLGQPRDQAPAVIASDGADRAADDGGGRRLDPHRTRVSTGHARGQTPPDGTEAGSVRGRVRRSDGSGLPDAALTLIDRSGRQVGRGVSGSDGAFSVVPPGAGSYVLIASADAHQPEASTIVVGNQPADLDIVLAGTAGLYGTVTAVGSGPIAGATVTMADARGEVVDTQRTSASGEYNFPDLVAGGYTLVASAESYRPFASGVTVPGVGAARHDVELVGGSRLHGTARAGEGHPVADARITLLDSAGNVVAVTNTDEAGEYSFGDLAEGDYTVIASGYPPVASTLQVGGGEHGEHDVELGHPDA
jgi:hypothetical protein